MVLAADPYNGVIVFTHRIASGSHVAISHITSDGTNPEIVLTIQRAHERASAPAVFRARKGIEVLFNALTLISPGVVEVSARRNSGKQKNPPALRFLGGVGGKA